MLLKRNGIISKHYNNKNTNVGKKLTFGERYNLILIKTALGQFHS